MTKAELKYYSSLLDKKERKKEKKFIAEGKKLVEEGILSRRSCEIIFATHQFAEENEVYLSKITGKNKFEVISNSEFKKLSDTKTPPGIAAVFLYDEIELNEKYFANENTIVCLENISDPGNVGTIIRTCDWFGVKKIILIEGCADAYNSKVIRGSMGSIFHVDIFQNVQLQSLERFKKNGFIFLCADMEGRNISEYQFEKKQIIFFSNESAGPSKMLIELADEKITIPRFGKAESLNVAAAGAVILAKIKMSS